MQLLLNALVFNVWLPNKKKREIIGRNKRALEIEIPWKSLQPEEEGLATLAESSLSAHCGQSSNQRDQCIDLQYLKDRILTAHPGSPKLCKLL